VSEIRLDPASVEAIARRVVELLADPWPLPALLSARDVAARLGVTEAWVRERADDFGGVRLADGQRPRLRFDPERVAESLSLRSSSKASPSPQHGDRPGKTPTRRTRGRAAKNQKVPLLVRKPPPGTLETPPSPKSKAGRRRDNGPPPTPRSHPSTRQQSSRPDRGVAERPEPSSRKEEQDA
jgi:hypothetical protein